jgi:hypothetical protein
MQTYLGCRCCAITTINAFYGTFEPRLIDSNTFAAVASFIWEKSTNFVTKNQMKQKACDLQLAGQF